MLEIRLVVSFPISFEGFMYLISAENVPSDIITVNKTDVKLWIGQVAQ